MKNCEYTIFKATPSQDFISVTPPFSDSKTCLIRHLCNQFHCVYCYKFHYPLTISMVALCNPTSCLFRHKRSSTACLNIHVLLYKIGIFRSNFAQHDITYD